MKMKHGAGVLRCVTEDRRSYGILHGKHTLTHSLTVLKKRRVADSLGVCVASGINIGGGKGGKEELIITCS